MSKDTIYRQEAIDALDGEIMITGIENAKAVRGYANLILDRIKRLPTAQPDIIRCNDCKWCEDADGLMCKNPASWVVAIDCDFGCVLAERRRADG